MRPTSSHLLLCCCLLLGIGWTLPARAEMLLTAKSISIPGVHLQTVTLRLGEDAAGGLRLQTVVRVIRIAAALTQGDVLRRGHAQ